MSVLAQANKRQPWLGRGSCNVVAHSKAVQIPSTKKFYKKIIKPEKSDLIILVEMRGFEPLTHALRTHCSTNWATPPRILNWFVYAMQLPLLVSQLHCSSGRGQALPALATNSSLDCLLYASRQLSHTPKIVLKCIVWACTFFCCQRQSFYHSFSTNSSNLVLFLQIVWYNQKKQGKPHLCL